MFQDFLASEHNTTLYLELKVPGNRKQHLTLNRDPLSCTPFSSDSCMS